MAADIDQVRLPTFRNCSIFSLEKVASLVMGESKRYIFGKCVLISVVPINFFVTFFCFQPNPDCLTSEARPNGKRGKERKVHPRTMPKPLTLLKSTNSSRNTARNETNHWYLLIHHVELLRILTPIQADLSKQNISLSEV